MDQESFQGKGGGGGGLPVRGIFRFARGRVFGEEGGVQAIFSAAVILSA